MVKKAYFFSMDAFIAVLIILTVIIVAPSFYSVNKNSEQPIYFSSDLIQILSTTKMGEINNSDIQLIINTTSQDILNRTFLEQVLRYQITGREDKAEELVRLMTEGLLPSTYGFGVWAEGYTQSIYSQGSPYTTQLLSSKQMISGIEKSRAIEGLSARIFLTGINELVSSSYVYFGGYEGDGNITKYLTLPSSINNITSAYMELDVNDDFKLYINDNYSGSYHPQFTNMTADSWQLSVDNLSFFHPGNNTLEFRFTGANKYIGGGYFKIAYTTSEISQSKENIYNFPGITGIINLYSSFYVPGVLYSMEIYLHYSSDYEVFLKIGDKTILDDNNPGENKITISNEELNLSLNYSDLSLLTVPLRFGLRNATYFEAGFGGTADTILITDISSSMDQCVNYNPGNLTCNQTRLDLAKIADKEFINISLEAEENQVGLVVYHATEVSGQRHPLTNDKASLFSSIDGYATSTANTCLSCAIYGAIDVLDASSNASRIRSMVLMTDGSPDKCYFPPKSCSVAKAKQESIDAACYAYQTKGIIVYAVGFGPDSDYQTLTSIAECGHGASYNTNVSNITSIYQKISEIIFNLSYSAQTITSFQNVSVNSTLFPDSYIQFEYTPLITQDTYGLMPITIETPKFGNSITQGSFEIPNGVVVLDAKLASYSADKWTDLASISSGAGWQNFYNLSYFGSDYHILGDPYIVNIPINYIQTGENSIMIRTGLAPNNATGGSPDDRAFYTLGIDVFINYTSVFEKAEGCTWTVIFEDDTNSTIKIPSDYAGPNACSFTSSTECQSDYSDDAINNAVCKLLERLDLDDNGKLYIKIGQDNLQTETVQIGGIPYMWGPTIMEVRVWK